MHGALTSEQRNRLVTIDRRGTITDEDRKHLPRVHFCNDWDFLPVCDGAPEMDCCTCFDDNTSKD